jgi:hypothetical protein
MKVLFLVDYVFKTGGNEYREHVLVSINAEPTDSFEKQVHVAIDSVCNWFPTYYPESELIAVHAPKPTVKDHRTNSYKETPVLGEIVHPMADIPPVKEGETNSKWVLIDVDGNKEFYTLGFYNTLNKEWIPQDINMEIDLEHAKWKDVIPD